MVLLVLRRNALQYLHRVRDCRFVYLHGLEPALERGVLLYRLVVFLQCRRGVHRALCPSRADHRVDLVEEEDHVPRALRLVDELLEALLELPAVLRSRDHARHVYRDDALRLHLLRHLAAVYRLREPLYDGGLAHAGLADENGVVLRAAREDLDDAPELLVASDDGVELPLASEVGEVASERVDRRSLLLLSVCAALVFDLALRRVVGRFVRLLLGVSAALCASGEELLDVDARVEE